MGFLKIFDRKKKPSDEEQKPSQDAEDFSRFAPRLLRVKKKAKSIRHALSRSDNESDGSIGSNVGRWSPTSSGLSPSVSAAAAAAAARSRRVSLRRSFGERKRRSMRGVTQSDGNEEISPFNYDTEVPVLEGILLRRNVKKQYLYYSWKEFEFKLFGNGLLKWYIIGYEPEEERIDGRVLLSKMVEIKLLPFSRYKRHHCIELRCRRSSRKSESSRRDFDGVNEEEKRKTVWKIIVQAETSEKCKEWLAGLQVVKNMISVASPSELKLFFQKEEETSSERRAARLHLLEESILKDEIKNGKVHAKGNGFENGDDYEYENDDNDYISSSSSSSNTIASSDEDEYDLNDISGKNGKTKSENSLSEEEENISKDKNFRLSRYSYRLNPTPVKGRKSRRRGNKHKTPSGSSFRATNENENLERYEITTVRRLRSRSASVEPDECFTWSVGAFSLENVGRGYAIEDRYTVIRNFGAFMSIEDARVAVRAGKTKHSNHYNSFSSISSGGISSQGSLHSFADEDVITSAVDKVSAGEYLDLGGTSAAFLACCDGHGGSEAAAFVQKHIHMHVLAHRAAGCGQLQSLGAAFLSVEQQLRLSNLAAGSGTCVVAAVLTGTELHLAHVGDCRAVALISGEVEELTRDHKVTDKAERARIRRAGGYVVGGRLMAVLAVSRSIGDYRLKPTPPSRETVLKRMEALEHDLVSKEKRNSRERSGSAHEKRHARGRKKGEETLIATPELATFDLRDADGDCELLVLASDGVWDVVESEDAVLMVSDSLEKGISCEKAAQELALLAQANGSGDDITVVVAQWHPPGSRRKLAKSRRNKILNAVKVMNGKKKKLKRKTRTKKTHQNGGKFTLQA